MGLVRVTVAVAMAVGSKATTTTTTTTLLPPIHTWESLRQTNREVAAALYSRCAHSTSILFFCLVFICCCCCCCWPCSQAFSCVCRRVWRPPRRLYLLTWSSVYFFFYYLDCRVGVSIHVIEYGGRDYAVHRYKREHSLRTRRNRWTTAWMLQHGHAVKGTQSNMQSTAVVGG